MDVTGFEMLLKTISDNKYVKVSDGVLKRTD